MSTDTKPQPVTDGIVWSWADDSHLTDAVIEESANARAELVAAMERCREARGAR